ncbi:UbiA-like polyprenyltransferase [Candidatus Scalindua japonica]|uniref:UbiA-like polyprenyltransferase n=1 Tax=Candidatus Scalindua japonica TaxID=1284222 RepID=UPI000BDF1BA5|nr:UbiA-like polyprenyltransferase [Candidatus Scalindua japonica]
MSNIENEENGIKPEQKNLSSFFTIFKLIKFSHTIFSFPFAVMSAFIAAGGVPRIRSLLLIIGALVMARSCAMSFNRLVDAKYDISNPRTAYRIQLQNHIGKTNLWFFTISCTILFIVCAGMLNRLSLIISPAALLVIFGYSYTKRFTHYSHLVLGLSLSLSPIGAWIGITGEITTAPFILALAVLLWTAGFDIIYACQDLQHDIETKLHSIPKMMGIKNSLIFSSVLHFFVVITLLLFMYFTNLRYVYFGGVVFVGIMLIYEHSLIKPHDLSKINLAFFTVNGLISMILMVATIVDISIFC